MSCCLNPDCTSPINQDDSQFCQNCGVPLVSLLRNRFKILKPLGRGGFGKTYLAEDTEKFNEECVVKQLAYQGASSAATLDKVRELFEREAKQLQKLGEHPQIPGLLAYFEENSYLYLVQQWIKGQTLQAELSEQGSFNDRKIRNVLTDLLPILQFIHQNGIVHRDLKPENIIRDQDTQRLVLIDFGVSKVLSSSVQSSAGTMLGSQGYSPVEQLLEGKASPASDLFSLGATCFHLLSNRAPVELVAEKGYRWSQHWKTVLPHGFQAQTIAVLDKLLQMELPQRYQSCEQVIADLQSSDIPATQVKTIAVSDAVISSTDSPPPHSTRPIDQPQVISHLPSSARIFPQKLLIGGTIVAILASITLVWALTKPSQKPIVTSSETKESQTSNNGSEVNNTGIENQLDKIEVVQLPAPNFQRSQLRGDGGLGLTQVSATPNLVTDTKAWFNKHQLSLPTYTVPNPFKQEFGDLPEGIEDKIGSDVIVKAIQGQDHLLLFYGPNYSGGTKLYGYDDNAREYLYGLDFSKFTLAPDNDPALEFVDQRINWAAQEGNILYVSHGHRTYARSSKGMNAYITAINLNTQSILWTSQPLVSNAGNFVVLDKYLISGYGFTAEEDYLYLLDKRTGEVVHSKLLDTAPEFIFRKGDRLLVRGYNIDYEFKRQPRR